MGTRIPLGNLFLLGDLPNSYFSSYFFADDGRSTLLYFQYSGCIHLYFEPFHEFVVLCKEMKNAAMSEM